MAAESRPRLTHADLLQLKRWNTPTIYNGWEQITQHDASRDGFNLEEVRDFMPQMGPMVGYAVTRRDRTRQSATALDGNPERVGEYRRLRGQSAGAEDRRRAGPGQAAMLGAFWGEVNSNIHRALGCVGTIIDGAIRDLDEMNNAGFKALARRLCVGHAYSSPRALGLRGRGVRT